MRTIFGVREGDVRGSKPCNILRVGKLKILSPVPFFTSEFIFSLHKYVVVPEGTQNDLI